MSFDYDKHLDSQTNKYLDSLEFSREELERITMERNRKYQALVEEFIEQLDDIDKEYKDIEPMNARRVVLEFA